MVIVELLGFRFNSEQFYCLIIIAKVRTGPYDKREKEKRKA